MESATLEKLREEVQAQNRASAREAEAYRSPYERWKESQGLPTIGGYYIENVYDVNLTPWEARGGSGVFINLDGTGGFNDSYIYELAPRESSVPIRHIYDELIFVLRGRGAVTVWNDEAKKQTIEWTKGSYFAIPPNAWHQWHNLSGDEPARYSAMTAAPRVPNRCCTLPSARRTERPRHFSVKSIAPSGVNARSHGRSRPFMTTVRDSAGGASGMPPPATRAASVASQRPNTRARRKGMTFSGRVSEPF